MKRTEWEAMHPDQRRRYADPTKKCIEKGCREPAGECDIDWCWYCGDEYTDPCPRHEGVDHV